MKLTGTLSAPALAAAYILDLVAGDPQYVPHPTRIMGFAIRRAEQIAGCIRPRTPLSDLAFGGFLTLALTIGAYVVTASVIARTRRIDRRFGFLFEIALAKSTLATRNLCDEIAHVVNALECADLARARRQLSRVVGRDTAGLDEHEIARAAIETLAESLCDGVVAPLCALTIGGTPAAMAFKAISTLDSMIGHIEEPYTFFGRVSARLDDLANFVPARITALLIASAAEITANTGRNALRLWLRDGLRHHSPNAGQSEAAMAGALGVRLGGSNRYGGHLREGEFLGPENRAPTAHDVRTAMRITILASVIGAVLAVRLRECHDA